MYLKQYLYIDINYTRNELQILHQQIVNKVVQSPLANLRTRLVTRFRVIKKVFEKYLVV